MNTQNTITCTSTHKRQRYDVLERKGGEMIVNVGTVLAKEKS